MIRVYLYSIEEYGILEARRLYINKTIWKLNKDALIKDHSYNLEQVMNMIFTYVATCKNITILKLSNHQNHQCDYRDHYVAPATE